jgi:hypothetical protein
LALSRETADLARRFRNAEIPWVLLKGPSLAEWLYPGENRDYGDIDVLVPEHRTDDVRLILASMGYKERKLGLTRQPRGTAATFQHGRVPIYVDLHVALKGATVPPERQWDALSRATAPMQVAKEAVSVLAKPALAAFVAMHAAQHGGAPKQKQDLERALRALDIEGWRGARTVAEELGALKYFANGLRLLPRGVEVAAELELPYGTTPELLLMLEPHRSALSIEAFFQRSSWTERGRFVIDRIAPPREKMMETYPIARRGLAGLLLAYLQRPFVLIFRTVKSFPGWRAARRRTRESN